MTISRVTLLACRRKTEKRSLRDADTKGIDALLSGLLSPEIYSNLIRLAYAELGHIAAHDLRNERSDHTLQPIELVHELFIRLAEHGPVRYQNRSHFFSVAARAMRQILIEHGRARLSSKRGGGWHRVSLQNVEIPEQPTPDHLVVAEFLQELERFDAHICRIVELRVLGGLNSKEVAEVLNIGESTICP